MDMSDRWAFSRYCLRRSAAEMRAGTTEGKLVSKKGRGSPAASRASKPARERKRVAVKVLSRLGRAMNMAESCGQMCR